MAQENSSNILQRVIFISVLIIALVYIVRFSIKKNAEADQKARECQQQCQDSGAKGHSFKWTVFSGPECTCL